MSNTEDIIKFLLARVEEDETAATAALQAESIAYGEGNPCTISYRWSRLTVPENGGYYRSSIEPGAPSPSRVLRQCKATRTIIEGWQRVALACHESYYLRGLIESLDISLMLLASVYMDHKDFRDEWIA